ncbi:MAG: hypothetical protein M3171_11520 [Actinomycetota bacterium]|nr:hypothetical protein [Actinomycetota bacterium]
MSLVRGALPATAAGAGDGASCRHEGRISTSIDGVTRNITGLTLTRTYLEKGVLNHRGDEPAATIRPHGQDMWCEHADFFGTAIKVTYGFGRNSHVSFEAWRYREGSEYSFADRNVVYLEAYRYQSSAVGSSCVIKGPSADRFTCARRIFGSQRASIQADFTVSARR